MLRDKETTSEQDSEHRVFKEDLQAYVAGYGELIKQEYLGTEYASYDYNNQHYNFMLLEYILNILKTKDL